MSHLHAMYECVGVVIRFTVVQSLTVTVFHTFSPPTRYRFVSVDLDRLAWFTFCIKQITRVILWLTVNVIFTHQNNYRVFGLF